MAQASLPCLPWVGTPGAALAPCPVLFVLRRWRLLIVPGDPALVHVTPISLEQKQLCWFAQEDPLPYGKGMSAAPLPGSRASRGAAQIHTTAGVGVEGLLAVSALRERARGALIRDSTCCGGTRLSCSLVLGGDISQSMAEELQEEWMFWNMQVNTV